MKLNLGLDSGTRFGHILNFKFRDGFTKKKLLFFWILSKLGGGRALPKLFVTFS